MTEVTLCRFGDGGVLERARTDILSVEYFAVSHVWADATWHHDVPGIGWEVLASDHKVRFLRERLPALVGNGWFWMDILCVDQRSEQARIDVVKHIPDIYRRAEKTIIIREPGGISSCCAEAVGDFDSWNKVGAPRLAQHIHKSHFTGLSETWFERLWPLQEMVLSECLLFSVCDDPSFKVQEVDVYDAHLSTRRLSDGIYCTAQAWVTYGLEGQGDEWEYTRFIKAIFKNGFVVRRPAEISRSRTRALINDFAIHCNSLRVTSKPRDFILAILPQYGWYKPPTDVKGQSFGQLWVDCHRQASAAGFDFLPAIAEGMVVNSATAAASRDVTESIPEPHYLGDFIKMFGCTSSLGAGAWGTMIAEVSIEEPDLGSMEDTLSIIRDSMTFATSEWQLAHRGDLSTHGMYPFDNSMLDLQVKIIQGRKELLPSMDDAAKAKYYEKKKQVEREVEARAAGNYYEIESIKVLNAMWAGLFEDDRQASVDWKDLRKELLEKAASLFTPHLLLAAALVSCNLGLSMLDWCRQKQIRPLVTRVGGFRMLLLATSECQTNDKDTYFCIQRGADGVSGRDIVLVSARNGHVVGKFPEFGRKTIEVEENVERLKLLYPANNILAFDTSLPSGSCELPDHHHEEAETV